MDRAISLLSHQYQAFITYSSHSLTVVPIWRFRRVSTQNLCVYPGRIDLAHHKLRQIWIFSNNTNQELWRCLLGREVEVFVFPASLVGKTDYGNYDSKCHRPCNLFLAAIRSQNIQTDWSIGPIEVAPCKCPQPQSAPASTRGSTARYQSTLPTVLAST